jgi:cystathionine gamma-synthase
LFSSLQSARECVEYSISPRRDNGIDKTPVAFDQIKIRAFSAKERFFAVTFPRDKSPVVAGFWATPGVGVSSRFAQVNLDHLNQLTEVDLSDNDARRPSFEASALELLRDRIIQYLNRAPLNFDLQPRPSTKDVYLYPSGMASIYRVHTYLLNLHQGTTVLFGMAFMNTITAFQEFGPNFKFFGMGTEDELRDLEMFLQEERKHGRKVQAIWAEFPANPILVAPNITRLHTLAREYDTVLVVDDTIGSFANIDIMSITDVLVTSLTKSFNGYADVIAGSVVLNPASPKYDELKDLFDKHYVPELYVADAEAIERNSRDYLLRTVKLNHNASSLVQYLQSCAKDPKSAIRKVYYPSINASGEHYKQFMRPATLDFTPGYGCLFSVELEDLPTTIAFYDTLNVHKGPHLGAPFTLAFAYTMCAYATKLDWAAGYGLKPTQIRISVGLENTGTLLEEFRIAVEAANKVKAATE